MAASCCLENFTCISRTFPSRLLSSPIPALWLTRYACSNTARLPAMKIRTPEPLHRLTSLEAVRLNPHSNNRNPDTEKSSGIEAGWIDLRSFLTSLNHPRNQPFTQMRCDLRQRPVTIIMDQVRQVFAAGQIQQLVGIGGEVVHLVFLVAHTVRVAVAVAVGIDNAICPLIGSQRPG